MKVISRKAAKAAGLKHYWSGKPCKYGHIDLRYVASFTCKECQRVKANRSYAALDADSRARKARERKPYESEWRKNNSERVKATGAIHRKAHKDQFPNYFKDFYSKNRERRKQESNEWYHANTVRALESQRAYVKAHPEQTRAHGRKAANTRRAIKKRVFVEVVDSRVVFERDKGVCGICQKDVDVTSKWEVDHIIPISKGGAHSYENVQLAHRKCNRSKSASLPKGQPTLFQVVAVKESIDHG